MKNKKFVAALLHACTFYCVSAQNVQWYHVLGNEYQEYSGQIVNDPAGNTYVTGTFQGSVEFGPTTLLGQDPVGFSGDIFLSKLNPDGSYAWTIQAASFDPTYTDEPLALHIDQDGNILLGGVFSGGIAFAGDVLNTQSGRGFLAKITPSGSVLWLKRINVDVVTALATDANNDIYLCGNFYTAGQIDTFSYTSQNNAFYTYLAKLDENGVLKWVRTIGNDVYNTSCFTNDLAVRPDGTCILAARFNNLIFFPDGQFLTPGGPADNYFLAAFDGDGDMLWKNKIQGAVYFPARLATDNAGNLYVSGHSAGSVKYKNLEKQNLYPANYDVFFLKLKISDGQPQWLKVIGNPIEDYTTDIQCDALGNFYAAVSSLQPLHADDLVAGGTAGGDFVLIGRPDGAITSLYTVGSDLSTELRHTLTTYPGSAWAVTGFYRYPFTFGGIPVSQGQDDHNIFTIKVDCPQPEVFIVKDQNTLIAPQGFATYQWLLDGQPIQGATGQTLELMQSGVYSVRVTGDQGCQYLSGAQSFIFVGTAESAANDCDILGSAENTTVVCRGKTFRQVSVFDTSGRQMDCRVQVNGDRFDIESRPLPPGVYYALGICSEGNSVWIKYCVTNGP